MIVRIRNLRPSLDRELWKFHKSLSLKRLTDDVSLHEEAPQDVAEFNKFDEDFGDEFQSKVIHLGDEDEVVELGEDETFVVEKGESEESEIEKLKVGVELKALAEEKGIKLRSGMKKQDIINEMMKKYNKNLMFDIFSRFSG